MSYDIPDDTAAPIAPTHPAEPSWDSVNGYWLAYWTIEEVQQVTDEKLKRAIQHFYPPAGPQHPQPKRVDHEMFRMLVDEQTNRTRFRHANRAPGGNR